MKKKMMTILLAALATAGVQADDYGYLTLQTADKATSIDIANGATFIMNGDGTMTVGTETFTLADLTSMYFTTTPIELVTIGDYGWATYCSANALDFTQADGLTVYQTTFNDAEGTVSVSPWTEAVAAGEGVLLCGDAGSSHRIPVTSSSSAMTQNSLTGIISALTVTDDGYYALGAIDTGTVGFRKVNTGVNIPANKAYYRSTSASSRDYYVIDGNSTGIKILDNFAISQFDNFAISQFDNCYDLSGRKIMKSSNGKMPKGLYIVNGKKVVVK